MLHYMLRSPGALAARRGHVTAFRPEGHEPRRCAWPRAARSEGHGPVPSLHRRRRARMAGAGRASSGPEAQLSATGQVRGGVGRNSLPPSPAGRESEAGGRRGGFSWGSGGALRQLPAGGGPCSRHRSACGRSPWPLPMPSHAVFSASGSARAISSLGLFSSKADWIGGPPHSSRASPTVSVTTPLPNKVTL